MSAAQRKSSVHDSRYRKLIYELIRFRRDSKMSQKELADCLGLTQSDISKVERFERRIDLIECLDWLAASRRGSINDAVLELIDAAYVIND